jgi:hypothetical protein
MISRLFKLKSVDKLSLKYYDDDGDLVNLEADIDISHALSISNVLKVQVMGNLNHIISRKHRRFQCKKL